MTSAEAGVYCISLTLFLALVVLTPAVLTTLLITARERHPSLRVPGNLMISGIGPSLDGERVLKDSIFAGSLDGRSASQQ